MTFGKISGKLANNPNWPSVFLHLVLKCCGILTRDQKIKCQKHLRIGPGLRILRRYLVAGWCLPSWGLVTALDTHHHLSLLTRNPNWCLLMTFPFYLSEIMFSHSTADSWLIHHIGSFTGRIIKFKSCSHNATFTYIPSLQINFYLVGFNLEFHADFIVQKFA